MGLENQVGEGLESGGPVQPAQPDVRVALVLGLLASSDPGKLNPQILMEI